MGHKELDMTEYAHTSLYIYRDYLYRYSARTVYIAQGTILNIVLQPITLPTKVHLVKAMVFPVVIYGYESWTIKKAQC